MCFSNLIKTSIRGPHFAPLNFLIEYLNAETSSVSNIYFRFSAFTLCVPHEMQGVPICRAFRFAPNRLLQFAIYWAVGSDTDPFRYWTTALYLWECEYILYLRSLWYSVVIRLAFPRRCHRFLCQYWHRPYLGEMPLVCHMFIIPAFHDRVPLSGVTMRQQISVQLELVLRNKKLNLYRRHVTSFMPSEEWN